MLHIYATNHSIIVQVGDTDGNVQLWTFKDHVINDWICIGVVSFEGENILGGTFFHNGKKVLVENLFIFYSFCNLMKTLCKAVHYIYRKNSFNDEITNT